MLGVRGCSSPLAAPDSGAAGMLCCGASLLDVIPASSSSSKAFRDFQLEHPHCLCFHYCFLDPNCTNIVPIFHCSLTKPAGHRRRFWLATASSAVQMVHAGLQGVDSFKLENSVHLCINAADPLANAATVQTASQQPVECRGVVG